MKRTLALTAMLGSIATVPAFAAGPTMVEAEPAPMAPAVTPVAPIRDRDFTGFSLGGQFGYGKVDTDSPDLDGGDGLYGLRAYYDYDFGDYVLGGGLQYDETDIDLDGAATVDSVLRAGVRGGYDYQGNLFYGTAGYAKAFTEDDAVSVGDSNGYFVGVGAESFITDNVTVGTELVYHKFQDFEIDDLEADATTANIMVNYRF
ncbi:porin family protein [Thalassococcus profundi]|uniref:Porin family protein n=1 Tax=Thalassococcus profundi TaxID=2282382 RepID=A0A369TKQ8_9RHOB|nr:outer membrane beta-barrel protein [Thalassococcus profundi]RDD65873.1 porin family protein [Thalassococcus profundi]